MSLKPGEGAVLPVGDAPWEGLTLLARAGAFLSTSYSSQPPWFGAAQYPIDPGTEEVQQPGWGLLQSVQVCSSLCSLGSSGHCQPWALVEACDKVVG